MVTLIGNFWVDEKKNKWTAFYISKLGHKVEVTTKADAELFSKTLSSCTHCTNCYVLTNCHFCDDCINCTNLPDASCDVNHQQNPLPTQKQQYYK